MNKNYELFIHQIISKTILLLWSFIHYSLFKAVHPFFTILFVILNKAMASQTRSSSNWKSDSIRSTYKTEQQ